MSVYRKRIIVCLKFQVKTFCHFTSILIHNHSNMEISSTFYYAVKNIRSIMKE